VSLQPLYLPDMLAISTNICDPSVSHAEDDVPPDSSNSAAVTLHPAHLQSGTLSVPIAENSELSFLNRSPAKTGNTSSLHGKSSVSVRIVRQELVLTGETSDVVVDTFPVACAEVDLFFDQFTGQPVVWFRCKAGILILLVHSGQEEAFRMLRQMGALGATRLDVLDSFHMPEQVVAEGGQSVIRKATCRLDSDQKFQDVAVKDLPESSFQGAEVRGEVAMLALVQGHPNIVRLHGVFSRPRQDEGREENPQESKLPQKYIMLEYIHGGDLHSKLAEGPFSEAKARAAVKDVLSALVHIHKRGVVHIDVKASNIMLTDDGRSVLVDFGLAAHCQSQEIYSRCGTPGYVAPEVVRGGWCGPEADIFSLGVVLYFILSVKFPSHSDNVTCVLRKTIKCKPSFNGVHFNAVSNGCKGFIQATMSKHADHRPSAMEALTRPWITGLSDHQALLQTLPPPKGSGACHVRRYHHEARAASVCLDIARETSSGPLPLANARLPTKYHPGVQGQTSDQDARSCSDLLHQQQNVLGGRTARMTWTHAQVSSKELIPKMEDLNAQGRQTRARFVRPWRKSSTEFHQLTTNTKQSEAIRQTPTPPCMPATRSARPRPPSLVRKLRLLVARPQQTEEMANLPA